MSLLLSFLSLLPRCLLGFCVVHSIWRADEPNYLLIKLSISGAVGFGLSSLASFLWIWFGIPFYAYALAETLISLAWTVWILIRLRPDFSRVWHIGICSSGNDTLWSVLLLAGTILYALGIVLVSLEFPHGLMDAWSNWNVVSRFIYLGGTEWQNTFLRQMDHPDYPFFMAMNNALTWVPLQKDTIWGPIAFHALITIFTAGLLFAFINALKGYRQAAFAVILFMVQPLTYRSSMSQLADFPLSYLILGVGGFTLLYLNTGDRKLALLSGFLAGLAAWTKNEGLVFLFICSVVWLYIGWRKDLAAFKKYAFGLALPLTVVVLFKAFLAPSNDVISGIQDITSRIMDGSRYLRILEYAAPRLWGIGGGSINLVGLIIVCGVIVGRSQQKYSGGLTILFMIAGQLSAYFFIYLVTPHDLEWHLKASIDRLYLHVIPLAFLWIFLWLKSPQEFSSKES